MPKTLASKQLNILHAEDDNHVFESCKDSVIAAFQKAMLPEPIIDHVTFCNEIFRKMLRFQSEKKVYDILLLDLELMDKSEYNGVNAINEIKKLSPHTQIFVLSGNIYEQAYHDKLQEYKDNGLIVDFFETSNHEKWCTCLINTVTAKHVGILHFSDMHISKGDNSLQIINDFTNNFHERADLLIFSGDIANRGGFEEFEKAKTLLTSVCERLNIRKCIYVPGNHDIQRNKPAKAAFNNFLIFKKSMEDYVSEQELDEILTYPDVENYADYINTVTVYPELRTIVCGLNSAACIEDEKFGYSYGEITAEQLRQAEEKLQKVKEKYPNYLVIETFHHNMFEPPYYFDYHNTGDTNKWIPPVKKQGLILKKSFENDINLLLIGHAHVSSSYSVYSHDYGHGKPLHIISAGLFSEKGITPLEPELTVNYLSYQIDLAGTISNMFCQPYRLPLTDGYWKKKDKYMLEV